MPKNIHKIMRKLDRKDEIEFFIDKQQNCLHYTPSLEELVEAFPQYKKKHFKKALKELS